MWRAGTGLQNDAQQQILVVTCLQLTQEIADRLVSHTVLLMAANCSRGVVCCFILLFVAHKEMMSHKQPHFVAIRATPIVPVWLLSISVAKTATLNVAPYGYTSWRHISYTSVPTCIYAALMSSQRLHFCSANSYTYDATQATPVQLIQLHRSWPMSSQWLHLRLRISYTSWICTGYIFVGN